VTATVEEQLADRDEPTVQDGRAISGCVTRQFRRSPKALGLSNRTRTKELEELERMPNRFNAIFAVNF